MVETVELFNSSRVALTKDNIGAGQIFKKFPSDMDYEGDHLQYCKIF